MNTFPAAVRARRWRAQNDHSARQRFNSEYAAASGGNRHPKIPPVRKIEWQLGGDELRLGPHQQPDAANGHHCRRDNRGGVRRRRKWLPRGDRRRKIAGPSP